MTVNENKSEDLTENKEKTNSNQFIQITNNY